MNHRRSPLQFHRLVPAALLAVCFSIPPAHGYNPPVDTAGPLTVRIEGPEEVTAVDTPVPIRVVLENRGDEPIERFRLTRYITKPTVPKRKVK